MSIATYKNFYRLVRKEMKYEPEQVMELGIFKPPKIMRAINKIAGKKVSQLREWVGVGELNTNEVNKRKDIIARKLEIKERNKIASERSKGIKKKSDWDMYFYDFICGERSTEDVENIKCFSNLNKLFEIEDLLLPKLKKHIIKNKPVKEYSRLVWNNKQHDAVRIILGMLYEDVQKGLKRTGNNNEEASDKIENTTEIKRIVETTNTILKEIRNKEDKLPKELTVEFPKIRQDQIVGRETEIKELCERLFDNKQVVLMNGMGGIGKTTVASVYATEYYSEYKHIIWIAQLSGDFLNDFINAQGLIIALGIDTIEKNPEYLFDEIVVKLKSITDTPCLMVIDNAKEDLYKFYDLLPSQPNWHILVTSREIIPHFDIQEIGFLNKESAIELFQKLSNRNNFDKLTITKIVEYVDYHTLTIEILALSIDKQGLSLEKVLTAIEENIETGIIIKHSKNKIENITSYLCFIFENITELNDDEKWLLVQFICLPPEYHSEKFLGKFIEFDKKNKNTFKTLLSDLAGKGWLLYNENNDSYKMHRIIADVITKSFPIDIEEVQQLLEKLLMKIIATYETKFNTESKVDNFILDFTKWVPYGEVVINLFENNTTQLIAIFQTYIGIMLKDLSGMKRLLKAKDLLEKAKDSYELNFGENALETSRAYYTLALIYSEIGGESNLIEAKILLEKAKIICEENHGKEDPNTTIVNSDLALVLQNLGGETNLLEAKELLLNAIKADEKHYGKEHPTAMIRYSNLGLVLQDLGGDKNLTKAKLFLEKGKDLANKLYAFEHPTTALSYSNLSVVLTRIGGKENLLEAKGLLEKAVVSYEKNLGHKHIKTADCYLNLGRIIAHFGENENSSEALKLLNKAYIIYKMSLGPDHPTTLIAKKDIETLRGGSLESFFGRV